MIRINKLRVTMRFFIVLALFAGLGLVPAHPAYAATYTVNSLADTSDGSCNSTHCTLREAIDLANGTAAADTIQFSVSGTITITELLPGILSTGGALDIDGSGHNVDISGAGVHRVFWVPSGGRLNLKNLDIRKAYTTVSGAGIYNSGTLTIQGGILSNNRADDHGGAIYSTGTLTITNTSFSSNSTDMGQGGALYVYTNTVANISDSSFYENYANGAGGAIYNNGRLIISDTVFEMNRATAGGAIFNHDELRIQDSLFALNSAANNGGAFYNELGGEFKIDSCNFVWNSATGAGGGVFILDSYGSSYIHGSILNGNTANDQGGGLKNLRGDFDIRYTEITGNHAGLNGGGVYNAEGLLYLFYVTLKSNISHLDGGGVYNTGNLKVDGTTFESNQADGNGGGLANGTSTFVSSVDNSTFYDNRADKGGGVHNQADLFVNNCTLASNRAATGGGGIFGNQYTWVHNSIVANSVSGGNCDHAVGDPLPDNSGNNIDTGTTCNWTTHGSLSNTNPLLGPLQLNGGSTETMVLLAGSPAVDGVTYNPPNECLDHDQRGYVRPFGLRCDIGAYERVFVLFVPQVMKH